MVMIDLASNLTEQDRYHKLFSDSGAAIQVLNSNTLTSRLPKDTINALYLVGGKVERLEIS